MGAGDSGCRAALRWRGWRMLVAICIAIGITACAPRGIDTDAAAAGSWATIAQIGEALGEQADVVCADGRIATVFMDVGLPTRVSLSIYVEDVGDDRMVELVREAAQLAWESDVRITSMAIQAIDRFEDRHSGADDIVFTLEDAYPELDDLNGGSAFDLDELEPVLGSRSEDLAALVGRQAPAGQICPPILDEAASEQVVHLEDRLALSPVRAPASLTLRAGRETTEAGTPAQSLDRSPSLGRVR